MRLEQLLNKHKEQIVTNWFGALAGTYPLNTARFLKSIPDKFANPVGSIARQSLQDLFAGLLAASDDKALTAALDPLIRVRAVQTMFTPSQATAFVLELKPIVRQCITETTRSGEMAADLEVFETRVDRLLLLAFDVFVSCRETIYQIKATQEKSRFYRAFARAGLVREDPDADPDSASS
jgi:hypothetical protein